ncbi:MAG TPA: S8 family serine peptidase [Polyangia bacterium]
MKRPKQHGRKFARLTSTTRLAVLLGAAALAVTAGVVTTLPGDAGAVVKTTSAPAPVAPTRLIVKLRPLLDQSLVTTARPSGDLDVAAASNTNPNLDSLLRRHGVRTVRSLSPGRLRERLQKGVSDAQLAATTRQRFAARAARVSPTEVIPDLSGLYVFDLGGRTAKEVEGALTALAADPNVVYAEPDRIRSAAFIPNDPSYSSTGSWGQPYDDLYGLKKIGTTAAWDTSRGLGVLVAVTDSGVDYNHPDLKANVWINPGEVAGNGLDDDNNGYVDDVRGWDFVGGDASAPTQDNDPADTNGHGTHVAGTIAAVGNNGLGVVGVAWRSKIIALRALDDAGNGTDSGLAAAIIYAADRGADVINASWGGAGTSQALTDAVNYAHGLGAVFVASAGNDAKDVNLYSPAKLPNAIAVASLSPTDQLSSFSNFGNKIEVAAPGEDILSLEANSGGYVQQEGTSMAAPHVSGVAALIISARPGFSKEHVRQALRISATNLGAAGKDTSFGYGRVNAAAAVLVEQVLTPKITSPGNNADVGVVPATITGSANGTGFRNYVLDFATAAAPTTWTVLRNSTTPVTNGTLGTFEHTSLAEGLYWIRLRAFDTAGKAYIDQVQVRVKFAEISSPAKGSVRSMNLVVKPGTSVPLIGIAGGRAFQRYRLEWAAGANPTSTATWATTGITLAGSGTQAVVNGPLGTWVPPTTLGKGDYTVRLVVTGDVTRETRTTLYLETDLVTKAWPKFMANTNRFHAALPVRQPDGTTRFLLCENTDDWPNIGSSCSLYAADGSVIKVDFPKQGPTHQPAVGDLNGLAGDEIVVPDEFQIKIFSSTFGLIRTISNNTTTRFFGNYPVQLVDLDNDGKLEIVTLSFGMISFEGDPATAADYLYVYKADGTLFSTNYPALITQEGFGTSVFAAVDLNGDLRKEILVTALNSDSSTHALVAYNTNGTLFRGWTQRTFNTNVASMNIGDLDNDGLAEIILQEWPGPMIRVLNGQGNVRTGWPVNTSADLGRIAIGDLDRDKRNEIVVAGDDKLSVLKANGTSFSTSWPVTRSFGAAVIADIDNDGAPEIVAGASNASHDARLTAYRKDATVLKNWLVFGSQGRYPGAGIPSVGEFTGDGKTDVMVNVPLLQAITPDFSVVNGSTLVYLSAGTIYGAAASDWPINQHDAQDSNALPSPIAGTCKLATVSGGWINTGFPAKTTSFTFSFDATPSASPINSTVGLSDGSQTAAANFPALVRFNASGKIDAYSGSGFVASTITYSANVKHRFRLVVNVTGRTYAAYVTPAGGTEKTIGTNLAFRATLNPVARLNNWAVTADSGANTVCGAVVQ